MNKLEKYLIGGLLFGGSIINAYYNRIKEDERINIVFRESLSKQTSLDVPQALEYAKRVIGESEPFGEKVAKHSSFISGLIGVVYP